MQGKAKKLSTVLNLKGKKILAYTAHLYSSIMAILNKQEILVIATNYSCRLMKAIGNVL